MYLIARLSRKSVDFVNYVNNNNLNTRTAFNIALAYALTHDLALPPAPVESVEQYFRIQHETSVFNKLGAINEVLCLNADAIRALCHGFYAFRCAAAYPCPIPLALRPDRGLVDFFGLSRVFPDGVLDVVNADSDEITRLVNGFNAFLEDAFTSNEVPGGEEEKVRHVAA